MTSPLKMFVTIALVTCSVAIDEFQELQQESTKAAGELYNSRLYARVTPELLSVKAAYSYLLDDIANFERDHYRPLIAAYERDPTLRDARHTARWLIACKQVEQNGKIATSGQNSRIRSLEEWKEALLKLTDAHATKSARYKALIQPGEEAAAAWYAAERCARAACYKLKQNMSEVRQQIDAVMKAEFDLRMERLDELGDRFHIMNLPFAQAVLSYEVASDDVRGDDQLEHVFQVANTALYDDFFPSYAKARSDDVLLRSGAEKFHYAVVEAENKLKLAIQVTTQAESLVAAARAAQEEEGRSAFNPEHRFFVGDDPHDQSSVPTLRAGLGTDTTSYF